MVWKEVYNKKYIFVFHTRLWFCKFRSVSDINHVFFYLLDGLSRLKLNITVIEGTDKYHRFASFLPPPPTFT